MTQNKSAAEVSRDLAVLPNRRAFLRRGAVLGLGIPFGGSLLAACSTGPSGGSSGGGSSISTDLLTVRQGTDMANLDPAFWTSKEDSNIADCILEGLVSFKPGTFELVNTLAETFDLAEDGLSYTFKLKEGIPFHGGYGEVTADDVKFSFERIAGITKPDIEAVYAADWSALEVVEVTDTYSGVIKLKRRFTPLERTTLPVMSGKIMSRAAVEELGDDIATKLIGTGPYQMNKWVPGQYTSLLRFEEYGGANSDYATGAPWKEIRIMPITEDTAAINALQAGDIDAGIIGLSAVDRLGDVSSLDVIEAPNTTYQFLSMNVQDPILSDIRVRQAIRLAVDVPGILEAAYDGKYDRANAIVSPEMGLGYWEDAPQYERDTDAAKALLAEAGQEGITLKLTTLNAQQERTAAQVIQNNLADIGITVELQLQDSAELYEIPGNGGGGPDRQLVFLNYVTEPDPHWAFVWWTRDQVDLWNFTNWVDDDFEAAFNEAALEADEDRRTELYVEMQRIWDESASVVWIAYWTNYYAAAKGLEFSTRPDASPLYWNIGEA